MARSERQRKKADREEKKLQERVARAENRARHLSGVDQNIIQRFWEIVNMFPKVTDPELERRLEHFILCAPPGHYFKMQQALFEEATPYMLEDPRIRKIMEDLCGKKLGLAVTGEYESTVTLDNCCFTVERGIRGDVPVLSVASRRDYADALLSRKDPVKLILGRKIKASHKFTLLRWVLPHVELLKDRDLFDKYLAYQDEVECVLRDNLTGMGY